MSDILNLTNLNVDDSGRVSFSGLRSGIDIQGTVDAIIAARRIPVDSLEAAIEDRQLKIDAYGELSSLMSLLNQSVDSLRGAVSFGGIGNIFETKQAFVTGSRLDGGSASDTANLIGVSVANSALTGSHTLEVVQTALAHKLGSANFTSLTDDLGTASGGAAGSISGDFTINGVTVDVFASDTLKDLRDRINNANNGSNATGVSASIVSVNASEHVLVLTADETGTDIVLADPNTTGVLASLGISSDGGTTFSNQLQAAQTAQFYADGLLDTSNTRYESDLLDSASLQLGSTGTLSFSTGETVNYSSTDTLQDLADAITAGVTGVTAQVVQDGAKVRLEINGASAVTFSETGGGSVKSDLGIGNARLLIERTSNTIDDLFEGMTLSLFQAEQGTTMKIDVEQDLNAVKMALVDFVEAYNAVKVFINQQQQVDPATGEAAEDAGALFGDSALGTIEQNLGRILGQGAVGVDESFSVLAQIGVNFVDNGTVSDPLLYDTLTIDDPTLDDALLNNPNEVRRLLAFDFASSDPNVVLLAYDANTAYSASGYTLNIGSSGSGAETSASIDDNTALLNDAVNGIGATASGSFTINGTAVAYDVTTDSFESLATAINGAAISGVSAAVVDDGAGGYQLQITSTQTPLTIAGDSGDLLSQLSLKTTGALVTSANINGSADGADDGSVTIQGNVLTATNATGAEGLRLLFTGTAATSGIQLDFTSGIAANLFFEIEGIIDSQTGTIQSEIDAMSGRNDLAQDRIEQMLVRLELQRETLLERFIAMETALAQMENVLENMRQTFDALMQDDN